MEEFSMARQSKREYLRSIHKRYRQGQRTEKTAMLEELCKVCGYNRKYAIRLLSRPLSNGACRRAVTRRSATYSKASIAVLAKVWEASGYLCSPIFT
jgi:protein-disulfide isomerase-like protein with CxxC motif